jgi:hypothetical protein
MKYKAYIDRFKNRFLKKKSVVRDPQLMHPDREWAIGLVIAVIIFTISGFWSIHTYLKNRAATALPIEDEGGQTVYRESVVKEALETVSSREQSREALTNEPVVIEEVIKEVATTTVPAAEESQVVEDVPESLNASETDI